MLCLQKYIMKSLKSQGHKTIIEMQMYIAQQTYSS